MVDATILHLKQLRQAQQHAVLYSGVASAWFKVKLAARWVGDLCFSPSRLFIRRNAMLPIASWRATSGQQA
jgi:hypothetical protein